MQKGGVDITLQTASSPKETEVHFQSFENEKLARKFGGLLLNDAQDEFPDDQRPRKRQRLGAAPTGTNDSLWTKLVSKLYFGGESSDELKGLREAVK